VGEIMTQQTKMPEPVAYLSCNTQTGQPEWSEDCVCQDNVYSVMETGTIGRPVIFADQAEAYKDACVREALEEAARRCVESPMMNTDVYCGGTARLCADRIRALIQPTKESKNG
jgi:hypothetical protein